MKIFFGNLNLANGIEYGETPIDFKVFGQHAIQLTSMIRGDEAKAVDRVNLTTRIEFHVRKNTIPPRRHKIMRSVMHR
ncbi:MAG: hypothetical protein LBQ03_00005, partial [Puniceicoccales bacterium]|nr:hypothetical protein [Puniceicoccales bacterium]